MLKTLAAVLVLPVLFGCAQPSQSASGSTDSGGNPSAPPAQGGAQEVTVQLTQGQASSAGGEQGATAEGAEGGATVRGTASTPTPCHRLAGTVARAGETVTLTVSATADPDAMCIQSIGAIPYTAAIRGLPAGTYTLRVLHAYPGSGWETATVLETQITAR